MLALRVDKKRLSIKDVEKPERANEALVRVTLSGICNTDLEIARGYAGLMERSVTSLLALTRAGGVLLVRSMRVVASANCVARAIHDIAPHEPCSAFTAATALTLSFCNFHK